MNKWYLLYVKGGKEDEICEFLKTQGFDAFYPKKKIVYKKQGIRTLVDKPMFPNYIFVESELDHVDFSSEISMLKCIKDGIVREVKYDNEGTSALYEQEQLFLEKLLGRNKVVEYSVGFIENDRVVITEGPLVGLESNIIRIDRHKRICTLEIEMLGQKREVKVSLEIVSKV